MVSIACCSRPAMTRDGSQLSVVSPPRNLMLPSGLIRYSYLNRQSHRDMHLKIRASQDLHSELDAFFAAVWEIGKHLVYVSYICD